MPQINFRVAPLLLRERFLAMCEERGVTSSEVLREALERFVDGVDDAEYAKHRAPTMTDEQRAEAQAHLNRLSSRDARFVKVKERGFCLGRIGRHHQPRRPTHLSPSQHHEEAEIMFILCTWIFWFIVGVAYTAIRARVK